MSKIQDSQVKSEAEIIADGGAKSQLINDTKIYVTGGTEAINKRLDEAIQDGDIGGGGLGINYIEKDSSNAKNSIGDWVTYADTAGENAVDGTGGSANVTFTRNTTDPLRSPADFLFSKDAVDRQGEGASVDFTIDLADQSRVLTIQFDYETSANYNDDDVRVQVYDVTNSRLIRVIGEDLTGAKGSYIGQFQASADSTSYRLILHVSSTNASAYDINLDTFQVGPQLTSLNSPTLDWQEYTPTFQGLGTVTVNKALYRVNGDSVDLQIQFTTGTTSASEVRIGLPQNFTVSDIYTSDQYVGALIGNNTGYGDRNFTVIASPNNSYVNIGRIGSSNAQAFSPRPGGNFFSSTGHSLNATIKVNELSSSVVGGAIAGTEVRVRGEGNTGGSVTSDVTDIDFTQVEDTTNSWNGTRFTAPKTGVYLVSGQIIFTAAASRVVKSYVNGVFEKLISTRSNDSNHHFQAQVLLQKGDELSIRSDAGGTLSNTGFAHHIFISEIAAPQTFLGNKNTILIATSSNGQSVAQTTLAPIVFENVDERFNIEYNTSTGIGTIEETGFYLFTAVVALGTASAGTGIEQITLEINGLVSRRGMTNDISNNIMGVPFSCGLYLVKGDTFRITLFHNNGATRALSTEAARNHLTVYKVG